MDSLKLAVLLSLSTAACGCIYQAKPLVRERSDRSDQVRIVHRDRTGTKRTFVLRYRMSFGTPPKSNSFDTYLTVTTVSANTKTGNTYKVSSSRNSESIIRRSADCAGFAGGFIHLPQTPVKAGQSWTHKTSNGSLRTFTFKGWGELKGQRLLRIDLRSQSPLGIRATALVDSIGDTVWSRTVSHDTGEPGSKNEVAYERIGITRKK